MVGAYYLRKYQETSQLMLEGKNRPTAKYDVQAPQELLGLINCRNYSGKSVNTVLQIVCLPYDSLESRKRCLTLKREPACAHI
jgi:hypothetical protein